MHFSAERSHMRYRALVIGTVVCLTGFRAQAQTAPQPTPGPQPGLAWTEAELNKVAHHVRAGRKLTPKSWPNGTRVAVCLSFDPDNLTIPVNAGNNAPLTMSEGEYGALSGIPRILKFLDRENLPASFYVPAVSALLHPQMMQEINRSGRHEVAMHGWIHEDPMALNDPEEEWRLISQAMNTLEKFDGKRPTGNRNPSWTMSVHTMALLKRAGLLYDSSLQAMDEPHDILIDGQSAGIVELPVNWILDDAPFLPPYASLPSPRLVMKTFKDDFDRAYRDGTLFMLTMHPHVSGQRSRMKYLEELVVYMKSKPGVWFATADEIARYVKQTHE
ncbi:MAG: polysaccharide deacetylase [Acidobacteria bacterium]|nr:MAG: polysaccharide deacetylase [Acidobacteriota bacterium]